jgi:hypothetical protein
MKTRIPLESKNIIFLFSSFVWKKSHFVNTVQVPGSTMSTGMLFYFIRFEILVPVPVHCTENSS